MTPFPNTPSRHNIYGRNMKRYLTSLFIVCALTFGLSSAALAEQEAQPENTQTQPKKKRAKMLTGTPVHTAIAGGGSLPKGVALTVYNFSLADKTQSKRGYKGSDVYNQTHLIKLRYGITNHWEITSTGGYVNNGFRDPKHAGKRPGNIEGPIDQLLGFTYAPLQLHQGDPVAVSVSAGIYIPTGVYGKNHLPAAGAWGSRLCTGFATFLNDDIRFDTEFSWATTFERGNQNVRKGDQYQWNTMVRYLFDWFDIGLESVYTHYEDNVGYRNGKSNRGNLKNGGADWYIGPNTSIAIDALDMWVGAGVYFPVMQDMNGPAATDDVQFHFKVAKMW